MNKKWCLGVMAFGLIAGATPACGEKKADTCRAGAEGCACFSNKSCDDGLSCFANFCLDLSAGGAPSLGQGGEADAAAGAPDGTPPGGTNSGGNAGSGSNLGGSLNHGGSLGTAGSAGTAGTAGTGTGGTGTGGTGTGGTGNVDPFPPDPAGCALVTTCPTCCQTTGVFALDALDNDATARLVTAFQVTSESALAEFDFAGSGQVGAIFFRFTSSQDIGALGVKGVGTGGSLEVALVRAAGKDGCIYPVVAGALSPTPDTCWGLGAGPYALLPADQIEIRVRSQQAGRAALNITGVEYGP